MWIAPLMLALACTPDAPITETDTSIVQDTDTNDTGASPSLSGAIAADAGYPMEGAAVRLCLTGCLTGTTDADGHYAINTVAEGTYAWEVHPPAGAAALVPMVPLTMAAGESLVLDAMWLTPDRWEPFPTVAMEIEIAPFVFVSWDPSEVVVPGGLDVPALVGARVGPAYQPPTGLADEIVGMWYLGPYELSSPSGFAVRLGDGLALPDGSYDVWVAVRDASAPSASWVLAGEVTSAAGVASGDIVLPQLSTVVITKNGG